MKTNDAPPTNIGTLHAGIVTNRFVETCEFYFEHLHFVPEKIDGEGAQLSGPNHERLLLLRSGIESQPAALRTPTRGDGVWMQMITRAPAELHASMHRAGVEIVSDLHRGADGRNSFVARDPNGVLLHITEPPPAAPSIQHHQQQLLHHDQDHRNSIHGLSRHRHEARSRIL